MKANATLSVLLGSELWDGGAEIFILKGTNGRWRNTIGANEYVTYEQRVLGKLGPECAE